MNLKHISTVDMVKELLARAEHMDALLALVNSGVARMEIQPPPTAGTRRTRSVRIKKDEFLQALSKMPLPKTGTQLARQLKLSLNSVNNHLRMLERAGKTRRVGNSRPVLWELA
jgi:DNA-binding transcriptional ArsR family regulator